MRVDTKTKRYELLMRRCQTTKKDPGSAALQMKARRALNSQRISEAIFFNKPTLSHISAFAPRAERGERELVLRSVFVQDGLVFSTVHTQCSSRVLTQLAISTPVARALSLSPPLVRPSSI